MLKLRRQPDYKLDLSVFVMQINYETLGFLHLPRSPHIIIWCECVYGGNWRQEGFHVRSTPHLPFWVVSPLQIFGPLVSTQYSWWERFSSERTAVLLIWIFDRWFPEIPEFLSPPPPLNLPSPIPPSRLIFVVIPPFNSRVAKLNLFLPFPIFLTLYFSHSVPVLC